MALSDGLVFGLKFDGSAGADVLGRFGLLTAGAPAGTTVGGTPCVKFVEGDVIYTEDMSSLGVDLGGPLTIAHWVYHATGEAYDGSTCLLHYDGVGDGSDITVYGGTANFAAGSVYGYSGYGAYGGAQVSIPPGVTLDAWHHVAYVADGTNNKFYLDGALGPDSTAPYNTPAAPGPTCARIAIGGDLFVSGGVVTPEGFYAESLHSLYVWNRALTSDEIATLYNSGAGLDYPFTAPAASGSPVTTNRLGISLGIGL